METAAAKPARLGAAERRREIELAAGRVFAERGYAAARLDDIAAAAGVTKPVIYRHFGSKKELYLALLERHRADLGGFLPPPSELTFEEDVESLLRRVVDRWLDYVRENSHAWVMLFRDHSGDEEIRAFRVAVSERAREVFASFIAAQPGSPIPSEQVEATAEELCSGLAGLALWWIDRPAVAKETVLAVAERMSAVAFAPGIRSASPSPG
jgi:AcrR family transcriptional regulator